MKKLRTYFYQTVVISFTCFCLLVLLEISLSAILPILKTHDKKIKYSFYKNNLHSELGWLPYPSNEQILWNTNVNTDSASYRVNNSRLKPETSNDVFLAIGDSLTFGAEVPNEHTWPSFLQEKTNMKVLNAGVNGYGIDQMYLNLKRILEKENNQFRAILIPFIYDDILRTAQSERDGMSKPYYKVENSNLILQQPRTITQSQLMLNFKKLLSKTVLLSTITEFLFYSWYSDVSTRYIKHTGQDPFQVSYKVFTLIKSIATEYEIPVLILPMNEKYNNLDSTKEFNSLTQKLTQLNDSYFQVISQTNLLKTLNYQDELKSLYISTHYWHGHLNFRGNQHLAHEFYRYIKAHKLLIQSTN